MKTIYPICIAMLVAFFYCCGGGTVVEDPWWKEIENEYKVPSLTSPLSPLAPITFNPALTYGTMTDQDSNRYKTITIGTQTWMAENLRTTKYSNGDSIPCFKATSGPPSDGSYCNYGNDGKYVPVYGRLYDKSAVQSSKNLAPPGWRIPGDADWKTLILYLDPAATIQDSPISYFSRIAERKLNEAGLDHWWGGFGISFNESGFTALPGGLLRNGLDGYYYSEIGSGGYWWSSGGNCMVLAFIGSVLNFYPQTDIWASVRCIKIN